MRKRREKSPDPKGLKDLGTFLDPDDLVEPEYETDPDDIGNCNNHFHRPRTRGGFDGKTVKVGTWCMIPDGNGSIILIKTPRRDGTIKKVSHFPATGETLREEY
ncbi:hypothetical protein [Streptomyces sp. NPDC058718]|uniref:hypothetical protein n=1 Tax=Streptomyces sp. NPDC058718 TaxID=3346610 RepID=UPI00367C11FE